MFDENTTPPERHPLDVAPCDRPQALRYWCIAQAVKGGAVADEILSVAIKIEQWIEARSGHGQ